MDNLKKHLFLLTKYSRYSIQCISPKTEKKYTCNFQNGIYTTDNDDEAMALKNSRYYNLDYVSDRVVSDKAKEQLVIRDEHGDNTDLYKKLSFKKRQELVKISNDVRRPSDTSTVIFKKPKEELIKYILDNKHKLAHDAI